MYNNLSSFVLSLKIHVKCNNYYLLKEIKNQIDINIFFILLYHRQLFAEIKLKPFFVLIFVENCLYCDAIHDFSVWLRNGSNPADINRLRSHTGKNVLKFNPFLENGDKFFNFTAEYFSRLKIGP